MKTIESKFMSRNQIKLIAVITMIIDHIGFIFFPGQWIFRFIGRFSFPLFAYLIADGMKRTRNPEKLLKKLLLFALISQIPYMLAFRYPFKWPFGTNIFVTLFLGAGLCYIYRYHKKDLLFALPASILVSLLLHCDYESYGVLMVLLFFVLETLDLKKFKEFITKHKENEVIGHFLVFADLADKNPALFEKSMLFVLYFFLSIPYCIHYHSFMQLAGILALYLPPTKEREERHWGLMGYLIYPVHLLLFWILSCTF